MIVAAERPATPDSRDRRRRVCEDLAAEWERFASGGPLCPPGCLCVRGIMIQVTAQEVEGDVLTFLEGRFPPVSHPAIAKLVASRVVEHGLGSKPLGPWLRALAEAPLTAEEFAELAESLDTVINSIAGPADAPPAGSRFTCT